LEVVSSFRYTTFAERSLLFQAFVPFRHLAVGAYNSWGDLRGTWAASVYKAGQDQYGDSLSTAGGNAFVGRATYLPFYDEPSGGRYYTHIGGAYAFVNPENNLARFRTSPEIYIGEVSNGAVGTSGQNVNGLANGTPFFVDTGNIRTVGYSEFGSELLSVHGPLSLQAEAMAVVVPQQGGQTLNYWGAYATVSYFLTGEHRPYDRKLGVYDRLIPFENFFRVRGPNRGIGQGKGAWEVAGRLSYIDLNGGPILNVGQSNFNATGGGGRLTDATVGLNWYMNPNSKVQLGYIRAMLNNNTYGYSNTNIFDLRYQMDF
jgi:phosphate-selective porin OprO/OprP